MQTPLRSPQVRLRVVPAAIFALAFALAGCSSGSGGSNASGVTIKNLAFTTAPVKSGSTVIVTNNDTVTHTVTADDGKSFDVTVNAGATTTFTAPAPGTYKFHCRIHSQMHGTLTVT